MGGWLVGCLECGVRSEVANEVANNAIQDQALSPCSVAREAWRGGCLKYLIPAR